MTSSPAADLRAMAALTGANGRVTFVCEADGTIAWVSPGVTRLLGWEAAGLVGTSIFDLYDVARRMAALTLAADRRTASQRAAAELDVLTGLGNRGALQRTEAELAAGDPERAVAVVYADLDDFKSVNDTQGHAVGDEVLRRFARRLRASLRDGDVACRVGGDEFVAICHGRWHDAAAQALGRRMRRRVNEVVDDGLPVVEASVGVAWGAATQLPQLLREADHRSYDAKRARRAGTGARVAAV